MIALYEILIKNYLWGREKVMDRENNFSVRYGNNRSVILKLVIIHPQG